MSISFPIRLLLTFYIIYWLLQYICVACTCTRSHDSFLRFVSDSFPVPPSLVTKSLHTYVCSVRFWLDNDIEKSSGSRLHTRL